MVRLEVCHSTFGLGGLAWKVCVVARFGLGGSSWEVWLGRFVMGGLA